MLAAKKHTKHRGKCHWIPLEKNESSFQTTCHHSHRMQPSEGHGAGCFGARWTWVAVAAGNLQGSWFSNPYRTHQYSIHRRKKCKAIESMWCNSGSLNIFNIMSAMQCSNVSSCIICPPSRGCHFMRQAFSFSLCVSPVPHAAEINQPERPGPM